MALMARFAKTISLLLLFAAVAAFAHAADPGVIQVRILPEAEVLGAEYTSRKSRRLTGSTWMRCAAWPTSVSVPPLCPGGPSGSPKRNFVPGSPA